MSQYANLKAAIAANVYENHNNQVTANMVKAAMNAMTDSLGAGYQYLGIATPNTAPGTPDQKVFYIASDPGTYSNFGTGISVAEGEVAILKYDTAWHKEVTGAATAAQVTELGQEVKMTPKFLFAENCPFIKEMYINDLGVEKDLGNVHLIYPTYMRFSNSAGTSFVARTLYSEQGSNEGVIPIVWESDLSVILGYVVVDWSYISGAEWPYSVNAINEIAKNIDYSPSIKDYLNKISTDETIAEDIQDVRDDFSLEFDKYYTEIWGANRFNIETNYIYDSVSSTSAIWFIIPSHRIDRVNRIKFVANTGTINFYKVKYDGTNATYQLITSQVIDAIQKDSIITLNVNVELAEDEFIGINGSFHFQNVSHGYKTRNVIIATGEVTDEIDQYLYVEPYYEDLNADIDNINEYVRENNEQVVMYSAKFNTENSDIVGTQNIVDGALRVGGNVLYLDKYYSLSYRTFRAICKNFQSDTIAVFSTVSAYTHESEGYSNSIIINIGARVIGCGNGEAVWCEMLSNYQHPFIIEVTKRFQDNIVRIIDMYNGCEWEHIWHFNGTGGAGDGAIGSLVNTGMAWDMYAVRTSNGTFDIEQIMVLGAKADAIFYGDSITEPEAYWPNNLFSKSWTQLLYEKSRHRILSSGRSGSGIPSLLERMQAELPTLKPKAVFITIGTNGGITYSEMETLVNYIRSLDIVPYVNHIPANINSGGVSNHAAVNAIVDQIRTQMGVKGIDFDKPTSVDYAGGAVNTATMWWEEYASPDGNIYHHPNELGSAAMVARAEVDTPEIYGI